MLGASFLGRKLLRELFEPRPVMILRGPFGGHVLGGLFRKEILGDFLGRPVLIESLGRKLFREPLEGQVSRSLTQAVGYSVGEHVLADSLVGLIKRIVFVWQVSSVDRQHLLK